MTDKEALSILEELEELLPVNWNLEKHYIEKIKKGSDKARKGEPNQEGEHE